MAKLLTVADLRTQIAWVTFRYPDESMRVIRTTLNPEILKSVLDKKGDAQLYDLDKGRWVKMPSNSNVAMEITEERPELKGWMEFVNRFV